MFSSLSKAITRVTSSPLCFLQKSVNKPQWMQHYSSLHENNPFLGRYRRMTTNNSKKDPYTREPDTNPYRTTEPRYTDEELFEEARSAKMKDTIIFDESPFQNEKTFTFKNLFVNEKFVSLLLSGLLFSFSIQVVSQNSQINKLEDEARINTEMIKDLQADRTSQRKLLREVQQSILQNSDILKTVPPPTGDLFKEFDTKITSSFQAPSQSYLPPAGEYLEDDD